MPLYQQRLKELNAADFGDLLLENLRLFQDHPDVLAQYQQRFHFMLVDEYQDTNVAQYLWLRLLAQGSRNICCVGDDDQSIYGWRGAEVDNILRFETDFPGAKIIRLERNYRSTGQHPRRRLGPHRPQSRVGSARRSAPTAAPARRSRCKAAGTTRRKPASSARISSSSSAKGRT